MFKILTNCFNCEKYLKEAIDSVFAQTFKDWKIIFVDNCSTDKSAEIIKQYPSDKIEYLRTKKTIPLGEARNFGLQFCDSEYLAFLDTDDIWLPNKLQQQFEIFQNNPDVILIYGGAIWIDENGKEIGELIPQKSDDPFKINLLRYEINMQSVAIRNQPHRKIEFNSKYEFAPDFDLFMKIISRNKTEIIPEPIVKYRKLSNSLTSKKINRWWVETKETLDKIFFDKELSEKYSYEKQFAYAKVAYYKARYLMTQNQTQEAVQVLNEYKNLSKQYFGLWLLAHSKLLWNFIHKFKK